MERCSTTIRTSRRERPRRCSACTRRGYDLRSPAQGLREWRANWFASSRSASRSPASMAPCMSALMRQCFAACPCRRQMRRRLLTTSFKAGSTCGCGRTLTGTSVIRGALTSHIMKSKWDARRTLLPTHDMSQFHVLKLVGVSDNHEALGQGRKRDFGPGRAPQFRRPDPALTIST